MKNAIKLGITVENVILQKEGILLEIPENYNMTPSGIQRMDANTRTDLWYKVLKVGDGVNNVFPNLNVNHYVFLTDGIKCHEFLIENKSCIILTVFDILIGATNVEGKY